MTSGLFGITVALSVVVSNCSLKIRYWRKMSGAEPRITPWLKWCVSGRQALALLKAPRAPWVDEKAASIQVGWEPEIPKNSYLTKNCITEKVQKERKMKKIDLFTISEIVIR